MKTLKQEGVPFGERLAFRLQHSGFVLMALGMVLTLPFAAMWALLHDSGQEFLESVHEVIKNREKAVRQHRERLIRKAKA